MKTDARGTRACRSVLVAGGMLAVLASCERRSETAQAVEKASHTLHAVNAGGSTPALSEVRTKAYTQVSGEMAGASAKASGGEKTASQMLASAASRGLSEDPAGEASRLEGRARQNASQILASLSKWNANNALAEAAEAFAPSEQLADLAKAKQEKDAAIATETARRDDHRKHLDELTAQAKTRLDMAGAKEGEYSRLMQGTLQMSAREAAGIVEQANAARREGEALRNEGSKIQAQADLVAPVLAEASAIVDQLTRQRASLDEIELQLRGRIEASKQEARDNRAAAGAAAGEIGAELDALAALRSGDLAGAYDKAQKLIKQADAAAKSGQSNDNAASKAALGLAQVAQAELAWARAQGAQAYASMLESLASAPAALPNASDVKARHAAALTEQQDLLKAASEAFADAQKAFGQARVKDKAVAERLTELGALLETASKVTGGEEKDVAAAFKLGSRTPPKAAGGAAVAPAPAATDESGAVRAVLTQFLALAAQGKPAEALALAHVTPETQPWVDQQRAMMQAVAKAEAACQSKLGASLGDVLGSLPQVGPMLKQQFDSGRFSKVKPEDFTISVEGDSARAVHTASPMPIRFARIDGAWRIVPEVPQGAAAGQLKLVGALTGVLDQWANDVSGGTYSSAPDAAQAFMVALQPVMMQMMGGGGGGG